MWIFRNKKYIKFCIKSKVKSEYTLFFSIICEINVKLRIFIHFSLDISDGMCYTLTT